MGEFGSCVSKHGYIAYILKRSVYVVYTKTKFQSDDQTRSFNVVLECKDENPISNLR